MNQRGFTLLELLISITLMALVVTISIGGFRLAASSIDKAESKAEQLQRIRSAFFVIDAQVQSILYVLKTEETEKVNYLRGDGHNLQFVSNTSLYDREGGYVLVNYRVLQDNYGKYELHVSERLLNQEQEGRSVLLLKGFDRIYFEYQYAGISEEQMGWHGYFSEKTGTPYVIKMTIIEGTKTYTLLMPVRNFRRIEGIR